MKMSKKQELFFQFCELKPVKGIFLTFAFIIFIIVSLYFSGIFGLSIFDKNTIIINYIFNADTALWLDRVAQDNWFEASITHPLRVYTWYPLAKLIALTFGVDRFTAAIILNAFCTATGMIFLLLIGLEENIGKRKLIISFSLIVTSSSNAILAAVDHFTFSFMLISIMLYISRKKYSVENLLILGFFSLLLTGTTITNVIISFGFLLIFLPFDVNRLKLKLFEHKVLIFSFIICSGFALFIYLEDNIYRFFSGESKILSYVHFWVFDDYFRTIAYFANGVTIPMIAPVPVKVGGILTLEPIIPSVFSSLSYCFAIISLYLIYIPTILKSKLYTKPVSNLCVFWILFNAVFHTFWGGELILFSPHYSACLFFLLLTVCQNIKISHYFCLSLPLLYQNSIFWSEVVRLNSF